MSDENDGVGLYLLTMLGTLVLMFFIVYFAGNGRKEDKYYETTIEREYLIVGKGIAVSQSVSSKYHHITIVHSKYVEVVDTNYNVRTRLYYDYAKIPQSLYLMDSGVYVKITLTNSELIGAGLPHPVFIY